MLVQITNKDPNTIADTSRKMSSAIDFISTDILQDLAIEVQKKAQIEHRYTSRTHNLERSVKVNTIKGQAKIYIDKVKAPYGQFVHDGTKKWEADPFIEDALEEVLNGADEKIALEIEKRL